VDDLTDIDIVTNDDHHHDIEDLDDDFNDIISALDDVSFQECAQVQLPDSLSLQTILEEVKSKVVITPYQYENNETLSRINMTSLEIYVKKQYKKLKELLDSCPTSTSGQIVSKDLGKFYFDEHTYSISSEYKLNSYLLFENEDTYSDVHKRIAGKIYALIREFLIHSKANEVKTVITDTSNRKVTHASRARIRYIGGYCIAKIRYKYLINKATHRYSEKANDKILYSNAKIAVEILNSLKEDEQTIMASTVEPDSLLDISRRQNLNRGLTNIPDLVFNFFIKLTVMCLDMLTAQNLNDMGEKMFNECQSRIESSDLYIEFVEMCSIPKEKCTNMEDDVEPDQSMSHQVQKILKNIFHKIVKLHLMVMFNQFRKDTLDKLQIGKKMAHRKQIRVSTTKTTNVSTKRHSEDVLKASNKRKKTKHSGISASNASSSTLTAAEGSEPQPGTSTADEGVIESEIKCKVCNTIDKEIQWIQCDKCNAWLHRNCAGLKHHLRWKKYQKKSSKFFCDTCK
jgi:hypothetical protein